MKQNFTHIIFGSGIENRLMVCKDRPWVNYLENYDLISGKNDGIMA